MTKTFRKTRRRLQASNGSKQISFLPKPDFNPKLPSNNTLVYQALHLMMQGKEISHLDFQVETDSCRLAAYVHDLIKLGWPIQTEGAVLRRKSKPKQRYYSRYFLDKEVITKFSKINGGALWMK
jgi:hypothetical protein